MSLVRIGYSGSRDGMTRPQMRAVYQYLAYEITTHDFDGAEFEFHHGDCTGGDCEAHVIATVLGCRTVAHPPANQSKRAWCKADVILPEKPYRARDWDIAQDTGELIAAPKAFWPEQGSGTWITTGYAVQLGRPATVFLPDGLARDGRSFYGVPLPAAPGRAS